MDVHFWTLPSPNCLRLSGMWEKLSRPHKDSIQKNLIAQDERGFKINTRIKNKYQLSKNMSWLLPCWIKRRTGGGRQGTAEMPSRQIMPHEISRLGWLWPVIYQPICANHAGDVKSQNQGDRILLLGSGVKCRARNKRQSQKKERW
jgi:hypothetical protein